MQFLSVGAPYDPDRRSWPMGADYNYRCGQHELRVFLPDATPREVAAIESGPAEFGLIVESEGLFLVVKFGRVMSFDCSYQWHRVSADDRAAPPPHEETSPALRALLTIIAVEGTTGLVLALRTITFSPEFTRAIHRAIAGQVAAPFDAAAHERWADGMLRFATEELWARAAIRCHGGD